MKNVKHHIDLKKFLPHRTPMLMVDDLLSIDGEQVSTIFNILPDCVFIKDGKLKESGIIENAAQTCSAIVGRKHFDESDVEGDRKKLLGFISTIKSMVINRLPMVGETLNTSAYLISKFNTESYSVSTMGCSVLINEDIIAEGIMNLFIQEI